MWPTRKAATPERRPRHQPLDLVVHVGTGKTGTTSLQHFMSLNRETLRAAGHLYPQAPGNVRHALFTLFLTPDRLLDAEPMWHRQDTEDPQDFRRRFRRRLFAEIRESGLSHVVLSEETLFKAPRPVLRRLRRFCRRHVRSLRLVVYLRRQDDHLVSRYQQGVKVGEIRRLDDPTLHLDYSDVYDYAHRLALIEEVLEPDDLVVRRYERGAFHQDSIFADFLSAVGIDVPLEDLEQPQRFNVSLDAESVEFLRLLNLRRVHHDAARAGMIDNRSLVRRLAAASEGPTLTLPGDDLRRFMSQWEEGNREVARRWFGEPDLFHVPSRTEGTTTVQRLDPERVDHFLEVGNLPGALRKPLRLLADYR